jgi:radical SAM superfamily enzyme YgiQ (UPF0313 family)
MRVVFLGIGAEQIGIELLSAILKREGHDVGLAFDPSLFDDRFQMHWPALARAFSREGAVVRHAIAMRPDVIAVGALTNTYRSLLAMASEVKRATGCKVIFGGVHPSAVPELVMAEPCVDAVCIGEGDVAFPAYVGALATGGPDAPIENLWFKREDGVVVRGEQAPFEQDLDAAPFPDKSLYEDEVSIADMYLTITGRGCPYRCTFCFNNFWAKLPARSGVRGGKYVRLRSVDHVIAELKAAKRRYGIRYIDFEDDVFTVDKRWIRDFTEALRREVNVPFMCLTHPKYVDEDIVGWLKEGGCEFVQIGIQSLDEHYKYERMKRYEKVGDVAWAVDAFTKAGIGVKGDHIFGSPGEGVPVQEVARRFYAEHTPTRISTFWMTYFPGLDMTREAHARGELTDADVARIEGGDVPAYHEFGAIQDPEQLRALATYEALFRLMPAMPASLRGRVRPEWLSALPGPLLATASAGADALIQLARRNPDHVTYAKHYLRLMSRHVGRELGLVPDRIPRVRAASPSSSRAPAVEASAAEAPESGAVVRVERLTHKKRSAGLGQP